MTSAQPGQEQRMEASAHLFMGGEVPEPLDAEKRDWLARQISAYPTRVHPERTCAIGALSDMALAEFCRLQSRPTADLGEDGDLIAGLRGLASLIEAEDHPHSSRAITEAADRLILYREALEAALASDGIADDRFGNQLREQLRAVLSRSGH